MTIIFNTELNSLKTWNNMKQDEAKTISFIKGAVHILGPIQCGSKFKKKYIRKLK